MFKGKLIVMPITDDWRRWKIMQSITYEDDKYRIIVPSGFITDFASVPKIFWNIVPPVGKYAPAAVVHDWLYSTKKLSRKEADKIFLRAMKELGVSLWKRYIMYFAVRAFGWSHWKTRE